jgi:hypothetical protein
VIVSDLFVLETQLVFSLRGLESDSSLSLLLSAAPGVSRFVLCFMCSVRRSQSLQPLRSRAARFLSLRLMI